MLELIAGNAVLKMMALLGLFVLVVGLVYFVTSGATLREVARRPASTIFTLSSHSQRCSGCTARASSYEQRRTGGSARSSTASRTRST